MPTQDFKNEMTNFRDALKLLVGNATQVIAALRTADELEGQNKSEMAANVTIAMRHLEDAAMRFGKAVQASDGGVSPLGGPNTPMPTRGPNTGGTTNVQTPLNNTGGSVGIPKFEVAQ